MKKFTNHTRGLRGINTSAGVKWIEPGATVEIDPKDIHGDIPDLGKKGDEPTAEDAALVEAVQAENADLKAQVADLTAKLEAATKK